MRLGAEGSVTSVGNTWAGAKPPFATGQWGVAAATGGIAVPHPRGPNPSESVDGGEVQTALVPVGLLSGYEGRERLCQ